MLPAYEFSIWMIYFFHGLGLQAIILVKVEMNEKVKCEFCLFLCCAFFQKFCAVSDQLIS